MRMPNPAREREVVGAFASWTSLSTVMFFARMCGPANLGTGASGDGGPKRCRGTGSSIRAIRRASTVQHDFSPAVGIARCKLLQHAHNAGRDTDHLPLARPTSIAQQTARQLPEQHAVHATRSLDRTPHNRATPAGDRARRKAVISNRKTTRATSAGPSRSSSA